MRLLVVEDNEELSELLRKGLEAEGFAIDQAETAEDASEALKDARYAAVVLDLGLPDRDGASVLREMRGRKDGTPVLVLTARGGLHDRVAGLQGGADDYLVKPFDFEELVARLRALLRRPGEMLGRVLQTANLALDTEGRQAFVDGKAELMSAQELTLLEVLLRRSGKVVPKSYIEDQLFGMTSEVGKSAVEVSVYRLRKRLELMGARVEIHTVRGLGYLLSEVGRLEMKMPFNSLLWRIIWLHLLAVAVLAVILPLAVRFLLNSTASSFEHLTVRRHEAALAAYLQRTPQGWRLNLPLSLKSEYAEASSGYAYAVVDRGDRVLFSSLKGQGALFPHSSSADSPNFFQRSHGAAVYYGGSFPEPRGGDIAWIQVAQDLEHPDVVVDDIVSAFLGKIAWLILPILVVLAVIDFAIVRRALIPVSQASDMARAIGPSSLQIRLPTDQLPDEIAPLARAVNQALDRLEHGFKVQREFTADAAHELRTPLTILRARLASIPEVELRRALEADSDRMARIVGQLLDVAELDSFVPDPAEVADLQALGAEMVEYMAPMALARGRRLALTGAARPVWVQGEAEILFQAVRNLVENALAHTPSGTTVEVKVDIQGALRVLDRGPGVAPAERELVFQRFWRRDRSKSGGAGLGLSIVKRIVEAHGGEVSVQPRSGGGSVFMIRLNRAGAPEGPQRSRSGKRSLAEAQDV